MMATTDKAVRGTGFLALATLVVNLLGCGDGTPSDLPPQPTSVSVSPPTLTLVIGEEETLTARVLDQNGNAMTGVAVAWSSSQPTVAVVDGAGLVTGVGAGAATITATAGSAQGTAEVAVVSPDRATLTALYNATGGSNWLYADNWLSGARLHEWRGVSTDAEGFVVQLKLDANNLTGGIPPELGDLARLQRLDLKYNNLTGSIPPELGNLGRLLDLNLSHNRLSGSIPPELGNLGQLRRLDFSHTGLRGSIPGELGDLSELETLVIVGVRSLGSPIPPELGKLGRLQTLNFDNTGLSGSIPPELGKLGSLQRLGLKQTGISGSIPAELGELAEVQVLQFSYNELSGSIPAELGGLAKLEELYFDSNALSGALPPELGGLTDVQVLSIRSNRLSGALPSELGKLANLQALDLGDNNLDGVIPTELGQLSRLELLWLDQNSLSGAVPAGLGNLADLESLLLDHNALEGPIPPEFGSLGNLRELGLTGNAGITGALSAELTNLRLHLLMAGDTGLCVPLEPAFSDWLKDIAQRRIAHCSAVTAYLTQAVQSRVHPVPLVANEKALLRVFVTANETTTEGLPPVRATFFAYGTEIHRVDIPATSTPIPTEVDEGDMSKSANVEVPGSVVRPGLEMVIEVDPDGVLDPALGVPGRIPETGRLAVEVRVMPRLDFTVIPFLWQQDPDHAVLDATAGMATDPEGHELLELVHTLLPVRDLAVTAHEPVTTSSNNYFSLLNHTLLVRSLEDGTGYWMGLMSGTTVGSGIALQPGRIAFAKPDPRIIAHELGHNMDLMHARCGGPLVLDPRFPQANGSIGGWGYDFRDGGRVVGPARPDLMSYCEDVWISDYSFTRSAGYRRLHERRSGSPTVVAAPVRSLLLSGGVGEDGSPFLNPAFVVDAPPVLPESTGDHRITGWTADGRQLFSRSFPMIELSEGRGFSFVFVLPVQPGWAESLAGLTLSGPGGDATLDLDSDRPMAILRDSATGRVRAILHDVPELAGTRSTPAGMLPGGADRGADPGEDLTVLFSRGIPDRDAWRR